MKRLFLIIIMNLVVAAAFAQLNTTLVVSPAPPGSLLSWGAKDLTYVINAQGSGGRRALIKSELRSSDGTLAGTTNLATARVFTLSGNLILSVQDVLPLQHMIFSGKVRNTLDKTGKLPADEYQLCVQLVTPGDFIPISEVRCRNFRIASFQLPIPMIPANETVLETNIAKTAITFRWTPVTPRPAEPVKYRVLVFEILENQAPLQALRSNQPVLEKDVTGTTQYIWQPQLPFNTSPVTDMNDESQFHTIPAIAGRFIWTVQTFDNSGQPFGDGNINGDGISEPLTFIVADKNYTINNRVLQSVQVMADTDGDGVVDADMSKTLVHELIIDRESNPAEPQLRAGVSTSRSNIRTHANGLLTGGNDEDTTNKQQKAGVSTSRSNIRTHANGLLTGGNDEDTTNKQQKAGVSTSRSNIPRASSGKLAGSSTNEDTTGRQQKAGVSTSRSNIRTHRAGFIVNSDGTYSGEGTAWVDGKEIPLRIRYRLKQLSVKNTVIR